MFKRMNLVMKRLVIPENNNNNNNNNAEVTANDIPQTIDDRNNNAEVGRQSRQAEVGPKIIIKFPFK